MKSFNIFCLWFVSRQLFVIYIPVFYLFIYFFNLFDFVLFFCLFLFHIELQISDEKSGISFRMGHPFLAREYHFSGALYFFIHLIEIVLAHTQPSKFKLKCNNTALSNHFGDSGWRFDNRCVMESDILFYNPSNILKSFVRTRLV